MKDIKYLTFMPPLPGATSNFQAAISNFAAELGTTGDHTTVQLGFGNSIPFWRAEATIINSIAANFNMARQTDAAIHFVIDDHIGWDTRPDLWNWYDPSKSGYDPENSRNVEWYDWVGTPNKRRYLTPNGVPSKSPHMCYNSPTVLSAINRIIATVVGPILRAELEALWQENKPYLFSGITIGAELQIDDYSVVPPLSQLTPSDGQLYLAAQWMEQDNAPRTRLGYRALTIAGNSGENPPPNFNQALVDVNRRFIQFWAQQFVNAGIPSSHLYTHIAAPSPQDNTNNAPIGIVFNSYERPGWTTYPQGTLANGFQPLYDNLAGNGNPAWGSVEANASFANSGAPPIGWERYLGWHFNHGAKLVAINVGAMDPTLSATLSEGAFGDEAMAAYKTFLTGAQLIE